MSAHNARVAPFAVGGVGFHCLLRKLAQPMKRRPNGSSNPPFVAGEHDAIGAS